jgi:LEA14-like dessication related protein
MDVRSTLFGSPLRIAAAVTVGLAALLGGAFALGVLGVPSVVAVSNAFGGVNATTTVIETDLVVNNPTPIDARLGDLAVGYRVEMNSIEMATGHREGIAIGSGNSTLAFTTAMRNEKIPTWWVSHLNRGERTEMAVQATVRSGTLGRTHSFTPTTRTVETDIIGAFNSSEERPVNAGAPGIEDPVAWINRTNATWGAVSAERTPVRIEFAVHNPKPYPLTITELSYDIRMNDVAMGEGRTDRSYAVPPGETRTVEAVLFLDNDRLDEWWVSHLEANQTTRFRIDFAARVDAGAHSVRVPLRGLTYEETIETDFFGTKSDDRSASNASNASDGGGSGEAASTETTATTSVGVNATDSDGSGSLDGGSGDDTAGSTTTDGNSSDGGLLALGSRTAG